MIVLKQVMVAADFSEQSRHVAAYAVELARPFQAEVVGCHVLEPLQGLLPLMSGPTDSASTDVQASDAREAMERLLTDAGADRFRVLIQKGHPSAEIVRVAKNEDVDMIVIGTQGRSGMAHLLLGSTAENVVRLAPCPVMVVRTGAHDFIHPAAS